MFYASYDDDIMSGYPEKGFVIDLIINCVFLTKSFGRFTDGILSNFL